MVRSLAGAVLVIVLTLAAGCTQASPVASPSSAGVGVSAGYLERPGNLHHGKAVVRTTGSEESVLHFDLGPPGYFRAPPGEMALEWIESYGTALSLEGASFLGSRPSSSSLVLRLVIGNDSFQSGPGQCRIDVTVATSKGVRGTFECRGMHANGRTIDARGTFDATR